MVQNSSRQNTLPKLSWGLNFTISVRAAGLCSGSLFSSTGKLGSPLCQALTTAFPLLLQSGGKKFLILRCLWFCLCDSLLLISNSCPLPLQCQWSDESLNLWSFAYLFPCNQKSITETRIHNMNRSDFNWILKRKHHIYWLKQLFNSNGFWL